MCRKPYFIVFSDKQCFEETNLDQLITLKAPILGPVNNFTAYIYIYIERERVQTLSSTRSAIGGWTWFAKTWGWFSDRSSWRPASESESPPKKRNTAILGRQRAREIAHLIIEWASIDLKRILSIEKMVWTSLVTEVSQLHPGKQHL